MGFIQAKKRSKSAFLPAKRKLCVHFYLLLWTDLSISIVFVVWSSHDHLRLVAAYTVVEDYIRINLDVLLLPPQEPSFSSSFVPYFVRTLPFLVKLSQIVLVIHGVSHIIPAAVSLVRGWYPKSRYALRLRDFLSPFSLFYSGIRPLLYTIRNTASLRRLYRVPLPAPPFFELF